MKWYVSDDPATLGIKIEASSAEEAVAQAVEAGEVGPGKTVTVRWDVKMKEGSSTEWWFAHTSSVQAPGKPVPAKPTDDKASTAKGAGKTSDKAEAKADKSKAKAKK